MNEHIPECPMNMKGSISRCLLCICDALSACEQRVLGEGIQKLLIAEDVRGFIEYGYKMGYEVAKAKYKKGKK